MFKYEIDKNYNPGVLLGYYNFDSSFLSPIKSVLNSQYKNNINYIEILDEQLKKPKLKRRKDKNYDELGMISLNWIEKIQYHLPGLIIQIIDVTDSINIQNIDINAICEPIIKNIQIIKNDYPSSNQIMIIKCFKKAPGLENNIKSEILKYFKYIFKAKSIYFIDDMMYTTNTNIIKELSKLIIDEVTSFYNFRIKSYLNKYNTQKNNEQKEYAIKYLIKIFLMYKISNIPYDTKKINYYEYINNAYDILTTKVNKTSYMFCPRNLKVIYFEIKNLADFLLHQILTEKKIDSKKAIILINKHINIFDNKNFFNEKNANNILKEFKNYKDIIFISLKWKYSWLKYIADNYKINYLAENGNILKNHIFNIILHIFIFLKKEPNFTKDIFASINKEIETKKIKAKYLEKVPKLYEIDGENIIGLLSDEDNLNFYISELINDNKDLLNLNYIIKIIKEHFSHTRPNFYEFYLINKHIRNDENKGDINPILLKILKNNNNIIYKFKNVYSHISNKLNKLLLEEKIENNENNNYDIFKIIKFYFIYFSSFNKELNKEQVEKINKLLLYDISTNEKNTIFINNFENKLFNIEINYNIKEVKLLDVISMNLNISLLRKNILINIQKIKIYFPRNNNRDKIFKEILLNKEFSENYPIKINFNYFVKYYFRKLYITNIELYLKNKLRINIINTDKKDIIFYNKNNNRININDIINIDIFNNYKNKKILVGKNENHIFAINYGLKDNNPDIYIKTVKISIKLYKLDENSQKSEDINSFEFKFISSKGYKILENKQLFYEYENSELSQKIPQEEYILLIKELGNYMINYKFNFTLINKNCPDENCSLDINRSIYLQCIEPFEFSNEVKSSIYFINPQNDLKSYPTNYPINIYSYIKNKLSHNIIITKIEYGLQNNLIDINSPIQKLFSKIKNYKIKFSSQEKVGFKSQITSKSNISGTIGNLKIFWASENLYNNKNFSEPFLNINIFEIGDININQLPLIIEGKYLNEYNKYQIYIKNNESISKIIQFSFEKENEDIDENYIFSGKTSSNEILTPLKEIKMLYNIYDSTTGVNIYEKHDKKVHKFNRRIIVNEYYIFDMKDKNNAKTLKNIIYYTPEIFKIAN